MQIMLVLDYDTFGDNYTDVAIKAAPYCSQIWFRIKNRDRGDILQKSLHLRSLLPNSTLILSGSPEIAADAGFSGVHLNANGVSVESVKERYPNLTVGFSAHSSAEAVEQTKNGADYITISPIFITPKPYPVIPIGAIAAPVCNSYAMGGINAKNVATLKNLGYKGVAGISLYSELKEICDILNS